MNNEMILANFPISGKTLTSNLLKTNLGLNSVCRNVLQFKITKLVHLF